MASSGTEWKKNEVKPNCLIMSSTQAKPVPPPPDHVDKEVLEIDVNDPQANEAAKKIQHAYRKHHEHHEHGDHTGKCCDNNKQH